MPSVKQRRLVQKVHREMTLQAWLMDAAPAMQQLLDASQRRTADYEEELRRERLGLPPPATCPPVMDASRLASQTTMFVFDTNTEALKPPDLPTSGALSASK
ncbi:MAG: hypothetical protein KGJ86_17380 [Chloroflexota bacterium]|nr:hypothetical protein [Chloroflexota bacterium]